MLVMLRNRSIIAPKGRPGMSDVSGLSFDSTLLSLVLLPSPVTLSVLSFSACWPFLLKLFCVTPV